MKIGIITFHRAMNFGAVLQGYALQRFLYGQSYDAYIIDYKNESIENNYKIFKKKQNENFFHMVLRITCTLPEKIYKLYGFRKFINNNLKLTKTYTESSIYNIKSENFDVYITGSDQVFNPVITSFDENYLLKFVNDGSIKMSYAASLGFSADECDKLEWLGNVINKFKTVSLRENIDVCTFKTKLNIDAFRNIDPVFLIESGDWRKLIKKSHEKKIQKKYVLIYVISKSSELINTAIDYAKTNHTEVLGINLGSYAVNGVHNLLVNTPEDFLYYIINAEVVFTTSFHGTAFSLIFKKRIVDNRFERIRELFDIFRLDYTSCEYYKEFNEIKTIDYEMVENIIRKEKNNTIKYFNDTLR